MSWGRRSSFHMPVSYCSFCTIREPHPTKLGGNKAQSLQNMILHYISTWGAVKGVLHYVCIRVYHNGPACQPCLPCILGKMAYKIGWLNTSNDGELRVYHNHFLCRAMPSCLFMGSRIIPDSIDG